MPNQRSKGAKQTHRKKAAALLDADGFCNELRFEKEDLETLKLIRGGQYIRNAASIIKAFELSANYAYGKPKQTTEHQGAVTILVETCIPRNPDDPPLPTEGEGTDD